MKPTLLIAAIGLALAGVFGYHTLYVPQQGRARVIRAQIAQAQADQRAQAEAAALVRDVETYRKRLPPEPDPSWLVRETAALAQQAGIELNSITPEPVQSSSEVTRLVIRIQCEASFHQVGSFLDLVERSERFIRVEQVQMSAGQEGGPAGVQMTLSTLSVRPPAGLASAPTPSAR